MIFVGQYGAEMVESSVKTISRPVIDRLPVNVNQLDEFACRQLDRVSFELFFFFFYFRFFGPHVKRNAQDISSQFQLLVQRGTETKNGSRHFS